MDRTLKKPILILLIFIINFSCATTIDEQIEAIKNAPESKRVELMNQFKRQLVLMNQEQREKAIDRLKSNRTEQPQPSNLINTIQSNNIEQNIQTVRDIQIINEIKLPNIPKIVEAPQDIMPNSPNPTIEQPQETPSTPNPMVEQPQEIPTTPNPTVEQPQDTPTVPNPTTGESQGTPTVPSPITPSSSTPSEGFAR